MKHLSLKGIARRYGGITGGFSVINDLFRVSRITGAKSLRSKLESMARKEHSFKMSECIYGWTAAFEQTWTHIKIRIKLNPDDGISDAMMNTLRTRWRNGIHNVWSDQWSCSRSGELTCPLTFEVQWVATNPHHKVRIRRETGPRDMLLWDTGLSGNGAAHEYGHMLGIVDEYVWPDCPDRWPVNTGTIMDNLSNNVPARMMTRFAEYIESNIVSI